ncbi:hypothetical protein ACFYW9_30335 [Streptomyces sp. NPDC002698]|uniref:hypothetical protein n=1 Tax=Streptomyces sp. NPDC002698 TaxID=3364660 RepID=UPI0036AFB37D
MFDHRLVQTAVIGHKTSDHPVILPMEAWELDRWREAHPNYSYWCGLQLGGCGGELSDRRYTTKVCHFAHHPTAPVCHRKNNGESSADHLFIKRGVRSLLGARRVRGQVATRDLGTGPGDAVDVHLPESRRHLRFQLSAIDYRTWRRADDELAADADGIDWIFASDGAITQQFLGRHGYCLRVRCETVGGERRVHVGAEARDRTVTWTPLEDCVLTPSGIVTPDTERIRLSRPRPRPTTFPLQGGLVFALVPEAEVPADSPFASERRQLLAADVKPVDSPIVRALVSLPADSPAPPAEHVYRITDGARLLVAEGTAGWAVEAKRYVRLNAHDAERTGLWTPPPALVPRQADQPKAATSQQRKSEPPALRKEAEPVRAVSAAPGTEVPKDRTLLSRAEMVTAVRDALGQHARLQSTTTWDTLARTVGPALKNYSDTGRRDLLVAVDTPLREHAPVLSALVRDGGEPLPYLFRVLAELGVENASVSHRIKRWAAVETERAFAAYGVPPRAMPPRLSLRLAQPVLQRPAAVRGRTATEPQRVVSGAAAGATRMRYLRSLVLELEGLLPALGKAPRKRARRSLASAQAWLALQDGEVLPASQRAKVAQKKLGHLVVIVEEGLETAKASIEAARRTRESQEATRLTKADRNPDETQVRQETQSTSRATAAAEQAAVAQLRTQLAQIAAQGGTIEIGHLRIDLKSHGARRVLGEIERGAGTDAPMLSAVVVARKGGPVPFFRDILKAAGLAVPQTDEALLAIWRRERERAYAAYANPPRPLPPRLVPTASQAASTK